MRLTEIRTDPHPIAVARIGLGIATVFNAFEAFDILQRVAAGRLAMPLLAGAPPIETSWLVAGLVIAVAAGIAVTFGWLTTPAAIVTVLLNSAVLVADEQTYSSHRWLATLLMAYLVFAQSDTAWSVRPRRDRATVIWWPQLLMMSQISVLYFFSALSKMNPIFITGAPLSKWVWIQLPWQFYFTAAVLTIGVELFIAIALWFRASRRLAVLAGIGLHLSIVILMNNETLALIAFAITCVSMYPLFLFRPRLRQKAQDSARMSPDLAERVDDSDDGRSHHHDQEYRQ